MNFFSCCLGQFVSLKVSCLGRPRRIFLGTNLKSGLSWQVLNYAFKFLNIVFKILLKILVNTRCIGIKSSNYINIASIFLCGLKPSIYIFYVIYAPYLNSSSVKSTWAWC